MRREGALAVLGVAAVALLGCNVGKGAGRAFGELFILDCSQAGDYCSASGVCGTASAPVPYDLQPEFFAGEPINDLRASSDGTLPRTNRLTIRLQRSGKRLEQNDVLTFEIRDSYEVARCVRGGVTASGEPDYDTRYCHRSTPGGPTKIRITVASGLIMASLSPRMTCVRNVVATAFDLPSVDETAPVPSDGSFDSWITFEDFGGVRNDPFGPLIGPRYRVELGQRLRAYGNLAAASPEASGFHLTLVDDQVVTARRQDLAPPQPGIGGTLDGNFDLDLVRGRGAQTFP